MDRDIVANTIGNNLVVEDLFSSIRGTSHRPKKWGAFVVGLFVFLVQGLFIFPLVGIAIAGVAQQYLPLLLQIPLYLITFVTYVYIFYGKFLELVETVSDTETVDIDNDSITVQKSGFLGIRLTKRFSAENIKGLTTSFAFVARFKWLGRLPLVASSVGAFALWLDRRTRPIYFFGINVPETEAQDFVATVCSKFPKYRYSSGP
jgi:hypothetical protein